MDELISYLKNSSMQDVAMDLWRMPVVDAAGWIVALILAIAFIRSWFTPTKD